ncbi:hypothetical protein [Cryobacterium sp. Y11]|uniref:hypothetical protein n=1 Tax=Cryobacterium sp. Y11 TaxID=2045016 RepID=UPI0011B08D77|nr:hypothetical protein [Cryobacterium sp. Y11]
MTALIRFMRLIGSEYRDEWLELRMHFATAAIPIDGFASYVAYRAARCSVCIEPSRDIGGEARYCSGDCAALDAQAQAHG